MKILIVTDLEGVAGVCDFSQTYSDGKYYESAKELLTEEVNACCDGGIEAGTTEIFVIDGYGSGGINSDNIHKRSKTYT